MTSPSPVIAEVVRSGFVESRHRGRIVALGDDAQTLLAFGDVDAPILPRSALKPLQTLTMLDLGWRPVDDASVAIATASHSGQPEHLGAVRRILDNAGLDESALQNTPDLPLHRETAEALLRGGGGRDRMHQNCSGKHAAMLATCRARGWPTDSYRDPAHPLQEAIRARLEELAGERITTVTVDGCGAPAYAVSMRGLARSFTAVASTRVGAAMRAHPHLVGGTGRDVTALMTALPGMTAKDGAEGVFAVAVDDAVAVVVKIEDGAGRARTPVLVAALRAVGVSVPALDAVSSVAVLGHGEPVGAVRATLPSG